MRTFLYTIAGSFAVIVIGYLWLLSRVRRSTDRRDREVLAMLQPVIEPLARGGNDFFVFKFRVNPPHWRADGGWTAGVAGPYTPAAGHAAASGCAFSHFEKFDDRTPEEHLEYYLQTLKPVGAVSRKS